ncbi:MAG: SDR family NAD(P)-dependent oxidoreductase [Planctomycetaceae bacterium]
MAKAGANVAINYHSSAAAAEEVVREIEALGLRGLAIQADVADQASVEHMIAQVVETFGSLDGFVSNAVYSDREFMVEADMAGFRRTIDVSMWGSFLRVRAAAQQMIKQGAGGAITVVSSPFLHPISGRDGLQHGQGGHRSNGQNSCH